MVEFMLCKVKEDDSPLGDNWIIEVKLDGSRCLFMNNQLIMRNSNIDRKERFKQVYEELKDKNVVLDGELCVFDSNGITNFNMIQRKEFWKDVVYVCFDILELDGQDLRHKPLRERKAILKEFAEKNFNHYVIMNESFKFDKNLIDSWKERKMEGYVAKRLDSLYTETRSISWLKRKFLKYVDVEIIGFKPPIETEKDGDKHGSLVCSINGNRTNFCVGLLSSTNTETYFKHKPKKAEIRFMEITRDERLRQPIFEKFVGID